MITWTEGDLFTCGIPAIAHGCNCRGVMDAGIAAQFRQRWPGMYEAYRLRCRKGAFIPGDIMAWKHPAGLVFCLATQEEPGPSAQPWMIAAAVGRMITEARHDFRVRMIAMPYIGCGIGGLEVSQLQAALAPYGGAPVDLVVVSRKAPS